MGLRDSSICAAHNEKAILRSATCNDLIQIDHCAKAAYSKYVESIGRAPAPMAANFAEAIERQHVTVCVVGEVVGFVVFFPKAGEMHLENVAVMPDFSGRGFGKQLIEWVEQAAVCQHFPSVNLYTNELMTQNLLMYPSLGYKEYKRVMEDGFRRVYFRKLLS